MNPTFLNQKRPRILLMPTSMPSSNQIKRTTSVQNTDFCNNHCRQISQHSDRIDVDNKCCSNSYHARPISFRPSRTTTTFDSINTTPRNLLCNTRHVDNQHTNHCFDAPFDLSLKSQQPTECCNAFKTTAYHYRSILPRPSNNLSAGSTVVGQTQSTKVSKASKTTATKSSTRNHRCRMSRSRRNRPIDSPTLPSHPSLPSNQAPVVVPGSSLVASTSQPIIICSPIKIGSGSRNWTSQELDLWRNGFFGAKSAQQLTYTLVYIFIRLLGLGLDELNQLTIDDQLVLVTTQSTAVDNQQLACTKIDHRLFQKNVKLNIRFLCDASLLYTHKTQVQHMSNINNSSYSTTLTNTHFQETVDKHWSTNHSLLIEHCHSTAKNQCLVCLHAFYLARRPCDCEQSAYFLSWDESTNRGTGFLPQPLSPFRLREIVHCIKTVLDYRNFYQLRNPHVDWAKYFYNDSRLKRKMTANHSFGDQHHPPNTFSHPSDLNSPLNLVVRECDGSTVDRSIDLTSPLSNITFHPTDHHLIYHHQCGSSDLYVCDACDKGFHAECLQSSNSQQPIELSPDRSLPWVCTGCQEEGYRVAIGTLPTSATSTIITTTTNNNETSKDDVVIEQSDNDLVNDKMNKENIALPTSPNHNQSPLQSKSQAINEDKSRDVVDNGLCDDNDGDDVVRKSSKKKNKNDKPVDDNCTATVDKKPRSSLNDEKDRHNSESLYPLEGSVKSEPTESSTTVKPRQKVAVKLTNGHTAAVSTTCSTPSSFPEDTSSSTHSTTAPAAGGQSVLPSDLQLWSVGQVKNWLLDQGFVRESELFAEQEIDGASLVLVQNMTLLTELGIKLGPAVKIFQRIKRLQSINNCPT